MSDFISSLLAIVGTEPTNVNDVTVAALAIRTLLEFVKREHKTLDSSNLPSNLPQFGAATFQSLVFTMIKSKHEIDVDLLLMLKEEG